MIDFEGSAAYRITKNHSFIYENSITHPHFTHILHTQIHKVLTEVTLAIKDC